MAMTSRAYLDALLAGDAAGARRVLDAALETGADARDLYLDVVQPALYEVGAGWSRAELSVAHEHLAAAAARIHMTLLAERLGSAGRRRGSVLVACPGDEMHELGARMVADFVAADGWEVLFLGALSPAPELADVVVERGIDVVALSAALEERIPEVTKACAALRALDPAPFVVVGGLAFGGSAERALATGAAAYARDAREAVRVIGGSGR
jgi:MerR family transcriptional regulator, light-induced transcriptional regulator